MRIVVTGAAGRIGRTLVAELEDVHEFRLLDRYRVPGRWRPKTDLARRHPWLERLPGPHWLTPWWPRALDGADALVHLAADSHVDATLKSVRENNFRATWNVYEAAVRRGVPRIVFASSSWAVAEALRRMSPDCYRSDGPKLGSDASPAPRTPYGASKAFGEELGRRLVDAGALPACLAVRIGVFSRRPSREPEFRARWVDPTDLIRLLERCLVADIEGFHVVYGVSKQASSPFDLAYTRELLGWRPERHPDEVDPDGP